MKRRARLLALLALLAGPLPGAATPAAAATPAIPATAAAAAEMSEPARMRRSGFDDMSAATQSIQQDDAANPAWLWIGDGEQRFARDCMRCHRAESLAGVAARYPAFDERQGKPVTLAGRIAQCQARHVGGPLLAPESEARLGLETFVSQRSRGLPISPPADARLAPWRERGRALFGQRLGQLDLSCAMCHERHAGQRLAGSVIPQGHPTGYPIYRLEWQGLGSLQRRLRGCLVGVRAEPFCLRQRRVHRARGLPDAARRGHEDRDAGGAAVGGGELQVCMPRFSSVQGGDPESARQRVRAVAQGNPSCAAPLAAQGSRNSAIRSTVACRPRWV